jgi:non-specific serine/threonine protein kinase
MTAKLQATLRPYQREGVSWLSLMTELGLGACLADDMGLGKTLQMLALLAARGRQKNQPPSLLVVPASLLGNWRAEARRFTPKLKLLFLHPSQTRRDEIDKIADDPQPHLANYDLVITTYTMAHRLQWLADLSWHSVILDEAQAIKNHGTRQSKAVRKLKAVSRVALTGTPVENNLGDLWSLFDFLNPGLLGSKKVFKDFIGNLEESGFEPLRRLVGPYILRRLKSDRSVITDLPEKTETVRFCNLTTAQVRLYKKVVDNLARGLESLAQGMERRGLVLQTLMRLKQVCNHPSQLTGDQQYDPNHSGKFTRLAEICTELNQRQDKVLVFTQYKEIIPHLEEHLTRVFGRPGLTLHGGTSVKKRAGLVDEFQEVEGPPFFIISLKAGGTGLNLTQACHVIHFDRWWNPAVENQATDRAFRIGQKQNVLVHKFVTTGTVEEKIDQMINDKKALAEQVLTGGEIKLTEMSDRQLLEIVKLDVNTI